MFLIRKATLTRVLTLNLVKNYQETTCNIKRDDVGKKNSNPKAVRNKYSHTGKEPYSIGEQKRSHSRGESHPNPNKWGFGVGEKNSLFACEQPQSKQCCH